MQEEGGGSKAGHVCDVKNLSYEIRLISAGAHCVDASESVRFDGCGFPLPPSAGEGQGGGGEAGDKSSEATLKWLIRLNSPPSPAVIPGFGSRNVPRCDLPPARR